MTVTYPRFKGFYSSVSPGWFNTRVYGNNVYLWPSVYFWFGITLTFLLAMAPHYVYRAYRFIFNPNDLDILRWAKKIDPNRDFGKDARMGGHLRHLRPPTSGVSSALASAPTSRRSTFDGERPRAQSLRTASRTDMSTGRQLTHRGFDFAAEEGGAAMRRLQSNLSAPRPSQTSLHHGLGTAAKQKISFASLRKTLTKRRPRTTSTEGQERH